ncbi:hypothetical protein DHEL01_v207638 [Diaporthe helianthi]|uniref:Uncharacterized protein n=1 Tax=Diaporthe helianthi TaxID=158607 RepID=A0A2P5HUQ3_DIAHE|nr:hypothetical protein DHEL01_v207638 [Diaporthe helianthi]
MASSSPLPGQLAAQRQQLLQPQQLQHYNVHDYQSAGPGSDALPADMLDPTGHYQFYPFLISVAPEEGPKEMQQWQIGPMGNYGAQYGQPPNSTNHTTDGFK